MHVERFNGGSLDTDNPYLFSGAFKHPMRNMKQDINGLLVSMRSAAGAPNAPVYPFGLPLAGFEPGQGLTP